jgi:CysZ protein
VFSDKLIVLLSLIPLLIGVIIYYFFGQWLYGDLLNKIKGPLMEYLPFSAGESIVHGILVFLLSVFLFFVMNFTFVLLVSIIASPFNDLISSRTEKVLIGKVEDIPSQSDLKLKLKRFFWVVWNEIKKILFILGLTVLAVIMGFVPGGQIVTLLLSIVLMVIQFVDYCWARKELSLRGCIKDFSKNFFVYGLAGLLMLFLIGLPIINLLALPFGVVFFTVIFTERRKQLST